MNGLMKASVSLGSSQRAARVTWSPHVSVPSGAKAESRNRTSRMATRERAKSGLMGPPLGGVDRGPNGPGDELQDLQHVREVVAAEIEHHVAEAEPLVLAEPVHDGLMPLGQELVPQNEADRELDGLDRALGRLRGGPQPAEAVRELGGRFRRRVPAVAERDHPPEGARAVAAHPDRRMGLLHGLGREADVVEAVELTVE